VSHEGLFSSAHCQFNGVAMPVLCALVLVGSAAVHAADTAASADNEPLENRGHLGHALRC